MKHLLLALVLLVSLRLNAQIEHYPDFGKPTAEEFAMKSCPWEKEAAAIFLRKDAKVFPDDYKRVAIHRVRIKILKDKGKSYADIKIPYYHDNDFEFISNIMGVIINNENGTFTTKTISTKDIYYKKTDATHSNVIFTFPEVHAGSILEYTYTSIRKSYSVIDYWYFQDRIPVQKSLFHFVVLPTAAFNYIVKNDNYPVDFKKDDVEGSITFEMQKLPGLPEEDYMDAARDYLKRVELQLAFNNDRGYRKNFVSSWDEAVKELLSDEDFGRVINKSVSGSEDILRGATAITDPYQRMSYIYAAIKSRLNWDRYQSIYASDRPKKIWDSRAGHNSDINLILISVLKSALLEVKPLLVSERDHGRVDINQPYLNQFNNVIAFVTIGANSYFLDATDPFDNTKLVPESLLNTKGFVVDKKTPGFVRIGDKNHLERKVISHSGKIDAEGVLKGDISVMEYDYSRSLSKYLITKDQSAFIRKMYLDPYHDISIDSFDVVNMKEDSLPLNQKIKYRFPVKFEGGYYLVGVNLFCGMERNPFIADNRFTDINFGSRKSFSFYQNYELDPSFKVEALPKDVILVMPDKSIRFQRSMQLSADGKRVSAFIKIEYLESLYKANEYPTVKEFYKKMYNFLEEPMLIKKQNTITKTP